VQENFQYVPPQHSNDDISDNSKIQSKISQSIFDLSQKITERTLQSSSDKYQVISPVSVASALQLALLGAKGNTYDEINSV
jgi:serine protease inhibitor